MRLAGLVDNNNSKTKKLEWQSPYLLKALQLKTFNPKILIGIALKEIFEK